MEALFHSWDSRSLSDIVALGLGAGVAQGPGGSTVAGAVLDLGPGAAKSAHWILVRTEENDLYLFASDKRGKEARPLVGASRGTFRASLHQNFGQVQLILFLRDQPAVTLKGKAWFGRRNQIRVARAVLEMAKES
jgi:hypothetical protein